MFLFSKKYNLISTNIFRNWEDCHSHILPGVDDGIRTETETFEILDYYESIGIESVWLTPHIMEEFPNSPAELQERFEQLKENYVKHKQATDSQDKHISLHLSAENMIDSLFVKRLEKGDILTYGANHNELLVETSYAQAPYRFKLILQEIRKAGLTPVLAHPERYRYMDYDDYETLREQGIRFQLNITSLAGAYGHEAKERAEYLLEEGCYSYQGSDLHSLNSFKKATTEKTVSKRIKQRLETCHLQ